MIDNKLTKLLSTLSRKEFTRFREFVHSPYFNKHKEVKALLNYFDRIYPKFDERNCHRRKIFKKIFPGEAHDQSKLAIVFTYTQRLMEEFLVSERVKEDKYLKNRLLLKDLRQRKQFKLYESRLGKTQKGLEYHGIRDSSIHQKEYELAVESDYFYTTIRRKGKDFSLDQQLRSLDHYYLAEKLKSAVEIQIRRKILKQDYINPMMKPVLGAVEEYHHLYREIPAIDLYYRIYLMVTQQETLYYFDALETLQAKERYFPKEELATIYNYFQNYCIGQINSNNPAFLKEIFLLYQLQLQQELIIDEGYLSDLHYKNIVTTGIRLQELEWVKNFIEEYRQSLRPAVRENAYSFNLASYYHAVGKYDEVLALLQEVAYSDFRYNLGAKALLLRTFYEQRSFEALYSLVDSSLQFLHRKQHLADALKTGYSNLFRLTRRVAHLHGNWPYWSTEKRQREMSRLEDEIEEAKAIFNKAWLVQQLQKLKTGLTD